jgi:hypothetical protein
MGNPFRVHLPLSTIASGTMQPFPPLPQSFSSSSSFSSSTSWQVHKREQMCIPGTRPSARLPSCVHGLVSVPRLKPKAEDETSELVRQCFFWELLTGIGVG